MAASFEAQPNVGRWLKRLYAHSGIDTRYTCVSDFLEPPHHSRLAPGQDPAKTLTTAERMAIYEQESVPLGTQAAREALVRYAQAADMPLSSLSDSITHLIVVSCTGFFAPGLDLAIAQQLNLAPTVARSLIGFMGCSAAFNGLRAATQIVNSQPQARVLVISVELCSLHIQPGTDRENLISAALFADGAAACLVGKAQPGEANIFEIGDFHTSVKPDTGSEMVWQIGDHGFTLRLSPKIPDHLGDAAPAALDDLLGYRIWPDFWAIHPGGKAIVDRLAEIFQLEPEQVEASRTVLSRVGNLSSATILFVLQALRQQLRPAGTGRKRINGVAMAFGPGLVIEMARLTYVPPGLDRPAMEVLDREVALA
jgi:predicted naringenin-chalcone synthase